MPSRGMVELRLSRPDIALGIKQALMESLRVTGLRGGDVYRTACLQWARDAEAAYLDRPLPQVPKVPDENHDNAAAHRQLREQLCAVRKEGEQQRRITAKLGGAAFTHATMICCSLSDLRDKIILLCADQNRRRSREITGYGACVYRTTNRVQHRVVVRIVNIGDGSRA